METVREKKNNGYFRALSIEGICCAAILYSTQPQPASHQPSSTHLIFSQPIWETHSNYSSNVELILLKWELPTVRGDKWLWIQGPGLHKSSSSQLRCTLKSPWESTTLQCVNMPTTYEIRKGGQAPSIKCFFKMPRWFQCGVKSANQGYIAASENQWLWNKSQAKQTAEDIWLYYHQALIYYWPLWDRCPLCKSCLY